MTGIIGDLLLGLGALAALVAGIWGYGRKKEKDGERKVLRKIRNLDHEEAERVSQAVDDALDADRDVSPAEWLQSQGRLRK